MESWKSPDWSLASHIATLYQHHNAGITKLDPVSRTKEALEKGTPDEFMQALLSMSYPDTQPLRFGKELDPKALWRFCAPILARRTSVKEIEEFVALLVFDLGAEVSALETCTWEAHRGHFFAALINLGLLDKKAPLMQVRIVTSDPSTGGSYMGHGNLFFHLITRRATQIFMDLRACGVLLTEFFEGSVRLIGEVFQIKEFTAVELAGAIGWKTELAQIRAGEDPRKTQDKGKAAKGSSTSSSSSSSSSSSAPPVSTDATAQPKKKKHSHKIFEEVPLEDEDDGEPEAPVKKDKKKKQKIRED
jgi:hypothetical protein